MVKKKQKNNRSLLFSSFVGKKENEPKERNDHIIIYLLDSCCEERENGLRWGVFK